METTKEYSYSNTPQYMFNSYAFWNTHTYYVDAKERETKNCSDKQYTYTHAHTHTHTHTHTHLTMYRQMQQCARGGGAVQYHCTPRYCMKQLEFRNVVFPIWNLQNSDIIPWHHIYTRQSANKLAAHNRTIGNRCSFIVFHKHMDTGTLPPSLMEAHIVQLHCLSTQTLLF